VSHLKGRQGLFDLHTWTVLPWEKENEEEKARRLLRFVKGEKIGVRVRLRVVSGSSETFYRLNILTLPNLRTWDPFGEATRHERRGDGSELRAKKDAGPRRKREY